MAIVLIISYILMIISTIIGNAAVIGFFSTLTSFLAGTLIMTCLPEMGNFWPPCFLLGTGIYMWFLGDLINQISVYVLKIPRPDNLIDTIYLFPNLFYGASVALYFFQKLKGRAFYQFLVNVFSISVIGFVFVRKILMAANAYTTMDVVELTRVYLYFFINIFIVIMMFHMAYMIAAETGLKGTNTMILGIFVYVVMDLPYNYLAVNGINPENYWLNLIYMICMMLMAHGIYHQIHYRHVFRLKEQGYNEKALKRIRIIIFLGIAVAIVLLAIGYFDRDEFLYVLIVMLGYWVTTASFQNSALNEQLIKQQDLLTGLYNRRYSPTVMENSVRSAQEHNDSFCVYCIDLNLFKPINDTYGHDMGDRVLKEFGARMLALPSDYVSFRTGGDEFMVVRNHIVDFEDVQEGAEVLLKLFRTPVKLDTYEFRLSGSIGAAIYRTHTENTEELVRFADVAMYSVKHSGKKDDFILFDREFIISVEKHKDLEEQLFHAVPERDFFLLFQPQLDCRTGRVTGAEVFPRLKGERNENVTAAEIIPIAEETGLINKLGIWIARESIEKLSDWQKKGHKKFIIKINLAPLQLLDKEFIDRLKDMTREYSVSPETICLDISNEVIMGADSFAKATLKDLCNFGFMLSLNNFGGGDINLSYILDCGFKEIDLSHSLIERAILDPGAETVIQSVIALADSMGVCVSAVGIETVDQAGLMKKMNIRNMQGFYYGKPSPVEEFETSYLE